MAFQEDRYWAEDKNQGVIAIVVLLPQSQNLLWHNEPSSNWESTLIAGKPSYGLGEEYWQKERSLLRWLA